MKIAWGGSDYIRHIKDFVVTSEYLNCNFILFIKIKLTSWLTACDC